jgi:hypothetical protein
VCGSESTILLLGPGWLRRPKSQNIPFFFALSDEGLSMESMSFRLGKGGKSHLMESLTTKIYFYIQYFFYKKTISIYCCFHSPIWISCHSFLNFSHYSFFYYKGIFCNCWPEITLNAIFSLSHFYLNKWL